MVRVCRALYRDTGTDSSPAPGPVYHRLRYKGQGTAYNGTAAVSWISWVVSWITALLLLCQSVPGGWRVGRVEGWAG